MNNVSFSHRAVGQSVISPSLPPHPPKQCARARARFYTLLLVTDLYSLLAAYTLAEALFAPRRFSDSTAQVAFAMLPLFAVCAFNADAYSIDVLTKRKAAVVRPLQALLVAALAFLAIAFSLKVSAEHSRLAFGIGSALAAVLICSERLLLLRVAKGTFGRTPLRQVVICDHVGPPPEGADVVIDAVAEGLRPELDDPVMRHRIGQITEGADCVTVACSAHRRSAWSAALRGTGVRAEILMPELQELGIVSAGRYYGQPTAVVATGALSLRNRVLKRLLDLSVVLFVAPVAIIISLLAIIAIKLEDGGTVLFIQTRIGRGNRLLKVYKFRTMAMGRLDEAGCISTQRGDGRVTKVGRILRRTSIDELPQLLNVLKGEMSIVGPRPHALGSTAENALFWEIDHSYWNRHVAKPGLTGLAQVRGFRGPTETAGDLIGRLHSDLDYLSGWSIWRDLRIIALTFRVLLHEKAY